MASFRPATPGSQQVYRATHSTRALPGLLRCRRPSSPDKCSLAGLHPKSLVHATQKPRVPRVCSSTHAEENEPHASQAVVAPTPLQQPISWQRVSRVVVGVAAVAVALHAAQLMAVGAASAAAASAAEPVAKAAAFTVAEVAVGAIDKADTAWVLVSTGWVLFMMIPGLSMFYGGLVKQRNVLNIYMQTFALTGLLTLAWAALGYSLAYDSAGMVEGAVNAASFIGGLGKAFLAGVTVDGVVGTLPESLYLVFQMMFAVITPGIMLGAFAERIKLSAVLIFSVLFMFGIYCPICHMVWGGPGALLGDLGVLDFAGGLVVHVTAGVASLVAAIMVGPRKQNSLEPHNLPMVLTGAGLLWSGWLFFNGGSVLVAGGAAAMAMLVTQISGATACTVWMALDMMDKKIRKLNTVGVVTGAIAGLAAITPAAAFVGTGGAFAIGAISAVICRFFALEVKERLGYDDALDVFGVHGMGSFIGVILTGIFASTAYGGNQAISVAAQLPLQTGAAFGVSLYTAVAAFVLLKITAAITGGLRVPEEVEDSGLDSAELNEVAYVI